MRCLNKIPKSNLGIGEGFAVIRNLLPANFMQIPDLINGLYEALAGVMLGLSCIKLYEHKEVKGRSVIATVFFSSWGYWNLWYYPSLHQWLSFWGGLSIVAGNTLYAAMWYYYAHRKR